MKLKTTTLIASIYGAVFYGLVTFLKNVYPKTMMKISVEQLRTLREWQAWTPMILGMIAILLFGFLVYKTDWKKGLKD